LFSLVVLLESLFSSRDTLVSVLKIAAFTFAAAAVLIGFKVTANRSADWTTWFLGLWIAVVALSAPTFFFPQIGFARNGTGFQGILSHPQSLGIFLAPMVGWLTATLLLSTSRRPYWLYVLTPVAWGFLFLTAARTGLVAVAASFLVILLVAFTSRHDWAKRIVRGAFRPVSALVALGFLALLLLNPSLLVEKIYSFVHKGQTNISVEQSFEQSRGRGIESQWENFKSHPMLGIGFGVSLDESFKPTPDPMTGLPLSAPVEKGFLPTAVFEENGLIGALVFLAFLFSLIRQVFSKADIALCWVFLASLFVNAGEMIFFSVNGPGLYMWVLLGWATCAYWEKKSAS